MTIIGENVKAYRDKLSLTQEDLGQAIGHASGSYISAIERGVKHPTVIMIGKIALALDVTEADLCQRHPQSLQTACG